jgi:hypothetical protein
MPPSSTPEKFWKRFVKTPSGCWMWSGARLNVGYGCLNYQGKAWTAHRLAWTLTNGPIPEGLSVLHRCDVRLCANPDHLFVGTQADNLLDMSMKGRYGKRRLQVGSRHHRARLTESDIPVIRQRIASGDTFTGIAADYSVHRSTIQHIHRRIVWRHVA